MVLLAKIILELPFSQVSDFLWGVGMPQWWERSPPTNVSRVQFPDPASYVGWVCWWFSSLLREVFLRVLRLSIPLKKPKFQALYHEPLARVSAQALPVFDIKFAFTFCIEVFWTVPVHEQIRLRKSEERYKDMIDHSSYMHNMARKIFLLFLGVGYLYKKKT